MKLPVENLRARLRRRMQDKIFVWSMVVFSVAFVYCFGWRPNWLYRGATEVLNSRNWWIDTYAHGIFGAWFSWVLIYGSRLSTEPPWRWVFNILGGCMLLGVAWEVGVEWQFDIWIHPWLEKVMENPPETMQKGDIDTNADLFATFLGSLSGLMAWKFVWRPAYAFFFPSQAKEELIDELAELYEYAWKNAKEVGKRYKEIWKNFRETRTKEKQAKKDSISASDAADPKTPD